MTTSLNLVRNSSGTSAKKELSFASKHFTIVQGKIKDVNLKLNNPEHGTAESCDWVKVSRRIASGYSRTFNGEKTIAELNYPGLEKMQIFNRVSRTTIVLGNNRSGMCTSLTQAGIIKEINHKRPLCIIFGQDINNSSQVGIIYGYTLSQGSFILHLADSCNGLTDVSYCNLNSVYNSLGINSYLSA
jgi:hypothetical protein